MTEKKNRTKEITVSIDENALIRFDAYNGNADRSYAINRLIENENDFKDRLR